MPFTELRTGLPINAVLLRGKFEDVSGEHVVIVAAQHRRWDDVLDLVRPIENIVPHTVNDAIVGVNPVLLMSILMKNATADADVRDNVKICIKSWYPDFW